MQPAQLLSVHPLLVLCQALVPGKKYIVPVTRFFFVESPDLPADTCTSYLRPVSCSQHGTARHSTLERSESVRILVYCCRLDGQRSLPSLVRRQGLVPFPRPQKLASSCCGTRSPQPLTKLPTALPALVLLQPLPSYPKVLYADPDPSPVPDSGNLRPAHFRTPRPFLLQIVPDSASQDSTSLLEHTVLPSPLRLRHRSQKPRRRQTQSRYRHDTSRVTALTQRGHTTIAIRRAQKPPKTTQNRGSLSDSRWSCQAVIAIFCFLVVQSCPGRD